MEEAATEEAASLEAASEEAASDAGAAVVVAAVVAVEEELPQPVNKAAPIAAVKRNAIDFFIILTSCVLPRVLLLGLL